jgi:hypothetical protein
VALAACTTLRYDWNEKHALNGNKFSNDPCRFVHVAKQNALNSAKFTISSTSVFPSDYILTLTKFPINNSIFFYFSRLLPYSVPIPNP